MTEAPVAIVDVASGRLWPNVEFAELLAVGGCAGAPHLDLSAIVRPDDWHIVKGVLDGITAGLIESCQGRATLRNGKGGAVDLVVWAQPIDDRRPCERVLLTVERAGEFRPRQRPWVHPALSRLSARQSEILQRLVSGESVERIASALFLSKSTVRNHLSAIYRKFGVRSQSALITRLLLEPGTRAPTDA